MAEPIEVRLPVCRVGMGGVEGPGDGGQGDAGLVRGGPDVTKDLVRDRRIRDGGQARHGQVELGRRDAGVGDGPQAGGDVGPVEGLGEDSEPHHTSPPVTSSSLTQSPVVTDWESATMARTDASPSSAVAPRGTGTGGGGVDEVLDLQPEHIGVLPDGLVVLVVLDREGLHLGGAEMPGVEELAEHAALAAVDLEAFPPVHPDRHGEVELAEAAVGVGDLEEPAVRVRLRRQSGPDGLQRAAEVPGGVEHVAAVAEDQVAPPVGLGVAGRTASGGTGLDDRLQGVGHAVAVGGVGVPVLQPDQLADLVANEVVGERDTGVVALLVADQHDPVAGASGFGQRLGVLDGRGHRLLDQHMLAGVERS